MKGSSDSQGSYAEGREDQFRQMMQAMTALEGKYKGVRGVLLAKVRAELAKLKPAAGALRVIDTGPAPSAPTSHPSCRVCGREMKLNGTDGRLVCQNGHTR